jgi:hypothetical protein
MLALSIYAEKPLLYSGSAQPCFERVCDGVHDLLTQMDAAASALPSGIEADLKSWQGPSRIATRVRLKLTSEQERNFLKEHRPDCGRQCPEDLPSGGCQSTFWRRR